VSSGSRPVPAAQLSRNKTPALSVRDHSGQALAYFFRDRHHSTNRRFGSKLISWSTEAFATRSF
jgi:hypothetical protein